MDAIKFLSSEHQKIRKTFAKINKKSHEVTKKNMFDLLCKDLLRHETMEEKIWYPYLKKHTNLNSKIKFVFNEEKVAAKSIKKIKKLKNPDQWEKAYLKFKKAVFKHAKDEENKLFPYVKKSLESDELKKIGKRLKTFKAKHANHFL